jgi:hypothetical protein
MWFLPMGHEVYTKKAEYSRNKNSSWEGVIINETVPRLLSCCNYQVFLIVQQRLMACNTGDKPGINSH